MLKESGPALTNKSFSSAEIISEDPVLHALPLLDKDFVYWEFVRFLSVRVKTAVKTHI